MEKIEDQVGMLDKIRAPFLSFLLSSFPSFLPTMSTMDDLRAMMNMMAMVIQENETVIKAHEAMKADLEAELSSTKAELRQTKSELEITTNAYLESEAKLLRIYQCNERFQASTRALGFGHLLYANEPSADPC
jgi:septal ring factor EnvC (AmiA/AmiB activator)